MEKPNSSIIAYSSPTIDPNGSKAINSHHLVDVKEETKVTASTKGQLPDLSQIASIISNKVRKGLSDFSEKKRKLIHQISIIFNYIVLGKKKELIDVIIKAGIAFNKTNFVPKTTTTSKEDASFTHKVSNGLENSSILRIEQAAVPVKAKRKIKDYIDKTLATDVNNLNISLTTSSEALLELSRQPAAKGGTINCTEALKHLTKVNHELQNMKNSTKKVHDDLSDLNQLIKEGPKRFDYKSLGPRQKKVFTDSQTYCHNLANAIGPVKDAFSTSMFPIFGASEKRRAPKFEPGMMIKMHSPLLNCTIIIRSERELKRLQASCYRCDKTLSSFREDIPYITRFAAEDSFRKVSKQVNYR